MELADRIQRTGSLYESDPQDQLLKSFQKRNFDRFSKVLASGEVNINHYYGDPEHGTILDLCALQDDRSQFLEEALKYGADPNITNRLRKKAPLHLVIERNDLKNLASLLKCPDLDINIADSFGNTPLHYAAKGSSKENNHETTALQMLLNVPNVKVNSLNRKGQCPAYLAVSQGNKDALLLLVYREDIDLDLNFLGKPLRDTIKEKFADILLPKQPLSTILQVVSPEYVFSLLRARNTESFKTTLQENRDLKDSSDGLFTLLQYACNRGLFKEAEFLLEIGADVNKTNNNSQYTPIMLALRKGYYRIVQRLMKSDADLFFSPVNKENVYHCVVMGSFESGELGDSDEGKDHLECLNALTNNASIIELINHGDFKGNTALHYAGRIGSDEMVFKLLEAGAYAGCVNNFGDPALSYISPAVFERYLDKCVKTNDKLPREESYEIIINYKCFMPPTNSPIKGLSGKSQNSPNSSSSNLNETDLLLFTSNSPDMQHLLMHPVLKSLIYVKWYNIRKLFYVNLMFYVLFCALLSAYILGFYDHFDSNKPSNNQTNIEEDIRSDEESKGFIWYLITVLLFFLIIRELFQFKKGYLHYLKDLENWLEMGLILLTITILFVSVSEETKHQLAASAILLSWIELVLLIGKHPSLSTQTEMLKTVGFTFFQFFSWYWILIMAFALSFYALFRNGRHQDDDENGVFKDPGVSVFKTIVMLTGEFEAGEIPFERFPITGHLLFTLFVFTIAIVLYNLLNGLAVSDTQAIKSNAEMVGYKSRIKLVSYVETIDVYSCKTIFSGFKSCDYSKGNITSGSLSCDKTVYSFTVDPEIHIFPNNRNKFEFSSSPSQPKKTLKDDPEECCLLNPCRCKDTVMDSAIVKSAQCLLSKKIEESLSFGDLKCFDVSQKLLEEYKKTLVEYKHVLQSLKETENRIRTMTEHLKT